MKQNMTQVMTNDMKRHDMRIYGDTEPRICGEGLETRLLENPQFAYGKPVVSLRETRSFLTASYGFGSSMLQPLFRHLTRLAAVLLVMIVGVQGAWI